ncbi:MAG: hypothetical protein ACRDSJ_19735, partial [Rubrobacteraceae bacterium]
IAVLSIVATLAFQSVAAAQYVTDFSRDECAGAAEQLQAERPNVPDGVIENYLYFVPDAGGCITTEGSPMPLIAALGAEAYDPDTGEVIGVVKDLDPDLSSGANSVAYQDFCGAFLPQLLTAQDYYDQQANAEEQAILNPDGDGLACTDEDEAFLSGNSGEPSGPENAQCIDGILDRDGDGQISPVEVAQAGADATQGYDPCSGDGQPTAPEDTGQPTGQANPDITDKCPFAADEEIIPALGFSPDVGCVVPEGAAIAIPVVGTLNMPVVDPETGEQIGIFKDLDPDLTSGDFSVTYQEFCGAFPTLEYPGVSFAGLSAQEYYDQEANAKEQAILDPNADGFACTSDDEAFLSGEMGYEPKFDLEDSWTGIVTQTDPDGETIEFDIEADMIPLSDIADDMIGEVIGEVGYPGVGCYGVWILDGFDGDEIMIEERVTEGRDKCFETPITLTPRDDGSLEYYFLDPSGIEGECILTLEGAPPPDVATDERKPSEIMDDLGITELPDTGGVSLFAPIGAYFLASGVLGIAAVSKRRAR